MWTPLWATLAMIFGLVYMLEHFNEKTGMLKMSRESKDRVIAGLIQFGKGGRLRRWIALGYHSIGKEIDIDAAELEAL